MEANGGRLAAVRVRWDETNLTENDKIKAELPPTKIDEPKTPFHSPPKEDSDDEYDPLKEQEEESPSGLLQEKAAGKDQQPSQNGLCATEDDGKRTSDEQANLGECSPHKEVINEDTSPVAQKNASVPPDFEARRKAHYNMAAALKRTNLTKE